MRMRNCACNLDTPLVCARKHQQMTMKCVCVAYRGHTARHCARASRGLVAVKLRKKIICNPRFEREIKLARL